MIRETLAASFMAKSAVKHRICNLAPTVSIASLARFPAHPPARRRARSSPSLFRYPLDRPSSPLVPSAGLTSGSSCYICQALAPNTLRPSEVRRCSMSATRPRAGSAPTRMDASQDAWAQFVTAVYVHHPPKVLAAALFPTRRGLRQMKLASARRRAAAEWAAMPYEQRVAKEVMAELATVVKRLSGDPQENGVGVDNVSAVYEAVVQYCVRTTV